MHAENAYRDEVIERHQAQDGVNSGDGNDYTPRPPDLGDEEIVISVILADKTIHPMPVKILTSHCDTVKRMVTSRLRFGVRFGVADGDSSATSNAAEDETNPDAKISSQEEEKENSSFDLSLIEFDSDATLQFMGVLISLHELHNNIEDCILADASSRKRRMSEEIADEETTNKHIMKLIINDGKISEQNIVECVKVAHYLQCRVILDALSEILERAIDSQNCMSLCSLADALNLKSLFESSVNYVIERLDALQGGSASLECGSDAGGAGSRRPSSTLSSDEGGSTDYNSKEGEPIKELWATLPYELRSRVLTMRNVMRSSVIGRGSKVSGLFFSSGNEFLAIFRETIRDNKERLADAKERHEEVIRERAEEWVIRCQRRGMWFDRSAEAKNKWVHGADVAYALEKIEKQSRRIATLESFYEEQKTIFRGTAISTEIRL